MRNLTTFLLWPFMVLTACQKSTLLGEDLVYENDIQVQKIDTLLVESATVLLDSLYTANSPRLLVGTYSDPRLGEVEAGCFYNPEEATFFSVPDDDDLIYDSLTLSLLLDYQYPATNLVQQLEVYSLEEALDEETLYFNYTPAPAIQEKIGEFSFNTRTARNRPFSRRLSDELGKRLFQLAKGQIDLTLEDILKGITLQQAPGSAGKSVLGFVADSLLIHLHYHNRSGDGTDTFKISLRPDYRFNQIKSERGQTALRRLNQLGAPLPAAKSNGETYVQAGVGMATQLEFPSLRNIRQNRTLLVNSAYLDLEIREDSYLGSDFLPLENLFVYVPSSKNTLQIPYWANNPINPVRVSRSIDPLSGHSFYRIYLTDYVSDIMEQDDEEYDGILLFSPVADAGVNEVGRVVLAAQGSSGEGAKLNILFTVIK